MESVTFVYSLATEQERQTEALKNQKQNQLEKYRALIQKQMEKERAFLSYKKVEFLSKQEAKLGGRTRPLSARARMGDSLPEITKKTQPNEKSPKTGSFNARTETRNLAPSFYRRRTHLGMRHASSKPKSSSTNTSPAEGRKSSLITLTGSPLLSSKSHTQEKKPVHFENETKGTRSVPKCKQASVKDTPKDIKNETLRKRESNLPKSERLPNEPTKTQREKVLEGRSNLRDKEKDRAAIDFTRSTDLHSFGKVEDTPTKEPGGTVSWAVVARLIGLKTKFKRRQLHGTFQAPELEVLDPSLKTDTKFGQEKSNDPWKAVKGCRYLRMPARNDTRNNTETLRNERLLQTRSKGRLL